MNNKIKILHLEDFPADAELVERELKKGNIQFEKLVVDTKPEYVKALKDFTPDIILSDHSLPSFNSIEALKIVKESGIDIPFVLVTATMSEEYVVGMMQLGVSDYILKDRLGRLPNAVINAIDKNNAKRGNQNFLNKIIANEKLMKDVQRLALLGSLEVDLENNIVKWSDEIYNIFGYEIEEVEPSFENILKRVHPDDLENLKTSTEYAIAYLDFIHREYRIVMNDGSVKYIDSELYFERDESKKAIRIKGFNQDISVRKKMEDELKNTLKEIKEYKYAIDESSIVAITDQKGIIKYVNDNFCKISKYNADELIGKDHRIINSGYHSKEFIRDLWVTIANGEIWHDEFRNKAKDGTLYWVDSTIVPFLDENNKPYQYLAIRTDITKRKMAEEEIVRSEFRFRELFETAPEALFVIDPETGTFLDYNDNALKLINCSGEELLKKLPGSISPPFQADGKASGEKIKEFMMLAMKGEHPVFEWIIINSKGENIFCEIRLNLLTGGARPLIRASVLDITEKVLLEKKLVEEKINSQKEITDAVIAAQEKERSFLGEELHDNINQILATSKLYLETAISSDHLRKDILNDSRGFLLSAMEEIRKLSKSLLPPSLGGTNLVATLNNLIENIEEASNLSFINGFEGIDESLLDEKLSLAIYRITQEQLNNILKHANAKTVIIELKQQHNSVQLRIKDDGVGFDTSEKRQGIGLKNIVSRIELFKGVLVINSQPGKGCELIVNFNNELKSK